MNSENRVKSDIIDPMRDEIGKQTNRLLLSTALVYLIGIDLYLRDGAFLSSWV
jgi:hypothetical protein